MAWADCGAEDEMRRTEELDAQQSYFDELDGPDDYGFGHEEQDEAEEAQDEAERDAEYFEDYEEIHNLPRSDLRALVSELQAQYEEQLEKVGYEAVGAYYDGVEDGIEVAYWENYELFHGLPTVEDRDAQTAHPIRAALSQGLKIFAKWIEG